MRNITLIIAVFIIGNITLIGQNVGIGTTDPNAELHVHDASDNSIIHKLTTPISELIFGFNPSNEGIIGSVSNHDLRFRTNNINRFVIDKSGQIGIGITLPTQKMQINNGSAFLSHLGESNSKGYLLGESSTPVYGWIYDGLGSGTENKIVLREYLGNESNLIEVNGIGETKITNLASNERKPLYAEADGTLSKGPEFQYISGMNLTSNGEFFHNLDLPDGARLLSLELKYLDDNSQEEVRFFLARTSYEASVIATIASFASGDAFTSNAEQTALVNISANEILVDNRQYAYYVLSRHPSDPTTIVLHYRIKYTFE